MLALSTPANSAETDKPDATENQSQPLDQRQLATMPKQVQHILRSDMLGHLAALNEIITHLAAGNLDNAAITAEEKLGTSSMGKHRAAGMGPGRFMPLEMRKAGWAMHEAASAFAAIAKQGDIQRSYQALQEITAACMTCHFSFRIR
jgi:hypothetical protein